MSNSNPNKEQKKACDEALSEPDNAENQEIIGKSESSEDVNEFRVEVKVNRYTDFKKDRFGISVSPTADDIESVSKELYQINNFLR